ncbi:protein kinase superfamily protein [Striga asiatica]|uniref:Protein kinase superfamily protein n=1 Tax=Striga asiatica TaxID=4170 RepID=A0A5A7Q2M0_STRAF|nr:protein kinase superfamily protein [Striga asiatica]
MTTPLTAPIPRHRPPFKEVLRVWEDANLIPFVQRTLRGLRVSISLEYQPILPNTGFHLTLERVQYELLDQFDRFLWLILNFPMVIAIPALPQIVHIIEIATAASLLLTTL